MNHLLLSDLVDLFNRFGIAGILFGIARNHAETSAH